MSPIVFFDKWIQRLRGSVGPLGVTEANWIGQRRMQGLRGETHGSRWCFLLAFSVLQMAVSNRAFGGVVTWQPAQSISGDLDVDITGTLVYAYNFGPNSGADQVQTVSVRGVTFEAFGAPVSESFVQVITQGNVTLSETPGELNGFATGASTAPFSSLDSAYRGLLGTAITANFYATMTLTLGGLDVGKTYRFQTWVNDSKYDIALYNRVEVAGGGSTVELKANGLNALGGLGQYSIGRFTATAATQDFTFVGLTDVNGIIFASKNPLVNAFQLRVESSGEVPEPTSLAIYGVAAWLVAYRSRRRQELV
jgi:hypothetical protein